MKNYKNWSDYFIRYGIKLTHILFYTQCRWFSSSSYGPSGGAKKIIEVGQNFTCDIIYK
jgi:hypothetical protein